MRDEQSKIINRDRGIMKVYAARDYIDDTSRTDNRVEVNIPEYTPTVPQDNKEAEIVIESGYFVNDNYPVTQDVIKSVHSIGFPILEGTYAPVRMNKGAEFLLIYPTGKIEEGFLVFIRDKEKGAKN